MIVWISSTHRRDNCLHFSPKFWSEEAIWDVLMHVEAEVKMDVKQMLCEDVEWIYLSRRG